MPASYQNLQKSRNSGRFCNSPPAGMNPKVTTALLTRSAVECNTVMTDTLRYHWNTALLHTLCGKSYVRVLLIRRKGMQELAICGSL
jgi:hypothetical protein